MKNAILRISRCRVFSFSFNYYPNISMYEFFTQYSIYVVLSITLTVWLGIAWYLLRLERNVSKLQAEISLQGTTNSRS